MSSRPPSQLQLERLVDIHAAQRQSILETLLRLLLGIWGGFDDWYDDDLVNTHAARSSLFVASALREIRRLSLAYNKAVFDEFGLDYDVLDSIEDLYPRSGVNSLEVYRRPAKQYRYARTRGKTPEQSKYIAMERVKDLLTTDIALADRDESDHAYRALKTDIGWRRILRPELSESGPCGLCVVASDRFYKSGDLMPLHDECVCGKMPITSTDDPGTKINAADLERIYGAAGGNTMEDLKRVRVVVRTHGEIGPVLVRERDHFRDAEQAGVAPYEFPTPESNRLKLLDAQTSVQGTLARLEARLAEMKDSGPSSDDRLRIQRAVGHNRQYLTAINRRLTSL